MTILVTGGGLVGTSLAQYAIKRGEQVVFLDSQPRFEYLQRKLGRLDVPIVQKDIRDLPGLIQAIKDYVVDTVVHTAGLIGRRVAESF